MKLTIAQATLSKALAITGRCVARHSSLPSLSAILLDARDGLALTATDLDRTLRLEVEANVTEPGRALIPARILTEVVGGLPNADVTLTAQDSKQLRVKSGEYRLKVQTLDPDDFPPTPELAEPASLTLPAWALRQAIGQVRHSVDENSGTRPALTGVLFDADGHSLTLAAADGFRLAVKTLAAPTSMPFTAIVPASSVDEMVRLLGDGDARLEVGLPVTMGNLSTPGASHAVLTTPNLSLTCRLIEGNFPRYSQLIPTDLSNSLSCAVADLRQALRVASPITRQTNKIVKLAFDAGGIELSAEAADMGDVRAHVDASVAAPAGSMSLNTVYLADALGAVSTERVEVAWQGPQRPLRVVGVGDETLVQVVMPITGTGKGK